MEAFIISQFNYCPLTRMFHRIALNNRINRIREQALRIVCQNKNLSFSKLVDVDNAVTIHQRVLVTEIFKVKNNFPPEMMKQVFDFQESYCNCPAETSPSRRENIKTIHHGIQSCQIPAGMIWAMVSSKIKNWEPLQEFKRLIRVWNPKACSCRMYKNYFANIGFI